MSDFERYILPETATMPELSNPVNNDTLFAGQLGLEYIKKTQNRAAKTTGCRKKNLRRCSSLYTFTISIL